MCSHKTCTIGNVYVMLYSAVKNLVRFRQWLNLESLMNHTLANDVIEILAYLAYDIVREVMTHTHTHTHTYTYTLVLVL